MKHFQVVIIGAGVLGRSIASELKKQKVTVAMVELPTTLDTRFYRLIKSFEKGQCEPGTHLEPIEGVTYLKGQCRFISPTVLQAEGEEITADKFVLATGSIPDIPSIQGLDEIMFRFPLDVLDMEQLPKSAAIIGAGPIGVLLADFLSNKNCKVTLLGQHDQILPREDAEITVLMKEHFTQKGIQVETPVKVLQVHPSNNNENTVVYEKNGIRLECSVQEVIVAAGTTPNTAGLGLSQARVYVNEAGRVVTEEEMRTSNNKIFAAGAITNSPTSLALEEYQARLVSNNVTANFLGINKFENEPIPFNIPTQIPFAKVGLSEAQARKDHRGILSILYKMENNRKAGLKGETAGAIKLVGKKRGATLLGAHVWGPHAEEMILYLNLIMRADISLHELTEGQHYLPFSYGEAIHHSILKFIEST